MKKKNILIHLKQNTLTRDLDPELIGKYVHNWSGFGWMNEIMRIRIFTMQCKNIFFSVFFNRYGIVNIHIMKIEIVFCPINLKDTVFLGFVCKVLLYNWHFNSEASVLLTLFVSQSVCTYGLINSFNLKGLINFFAFLFISWHFNLRASSLITSSVILCIHTGFIYYCFLYTNKLKGLYYSFFIFLIWNLFCTSLCV